MKPASLLTVAVALLSALGRPVSAEGPPWLERAEFLSSGQIPAFTSAERLAAAIVASLPADDLTPVGLGNWNLASARKSIDIQSLETRIAQGLLIHREILLDDIKLPACTIRAAKSFLNHMIA